MRSRRESSELPRIALAGYTNAGKSTLLNALTDAEVDVGERLFETVDPTTRSFRHEGRNYLVTDTVGFIRKLPHQLVEAFKATLEETVNADLILHVVDASVPEDELEQMVRAVDDVLDEIGASENPRLVVLNKCDLLDREERRALEHLHREGVQVSAETGEGLETLKTRIEAEFRSTLERVDLLVPFDRGSVISELHEVAGDLEREDTPAGVRVRARVPAGVAARLRAYDLNGRPATGGRDDGDGG
jgi:GTP-binding protein HflX